jgi:DNA polymerase
VNDTLRQAAALSLPLLEKLRDSFGTSPTASRSVLEHLHAVQAAARAVPPPVRLVTPVAAPAPVIAAPAAPVVIPLSTPAPTAVAQEETQSGTTAWTLDSLRDAALKCVKCSHLVDSRTQVVFGVGNPHAELMFVGEAPGADEDAAGEPFVGKAGQLLTKIIQAMGFTRDDVYIANVLKCRPDMPQGAMGNRKPKPEEMSTCLPWLEKQIELIQPRVMVALGATALEGLLGSTAPVSKMRGRWLEFRGIPVMPTYHPAYLLRNQSIGEKRKVWEDMLQVLEHMDKPITEKQRRFFTQTGDRS